MARRTNHKAILLITLPFLMFVFGYALTSLCLSKSTVDVPGVVGQPIHKAVQALSAAGLNIRLIESVELDNVPGGTVLMQVPCAASKAKNGSTVFLKISNKHTTKHIPYLVKSTETEVLNTADIANVPFKLVEYRHNLPAGTCFAQYPSAGNKNFCGTGTAYISTGQDNLVIIPSFIGMATRHAEKILSKYEIKLDCDENLGEIEDSTAPLIAEQRPMPGSIIDLSAGATILVTTKANSDQIKSPFQSPNPKYGKNT